MAARIQTCIAPKGIGLAALGLAWLAAWGQAPEEAAAENARLEAVTVTAQRRLERLQDVPAAVKAFSARQIEDMGVTSTQDFINLTPNMSFDNSFTYGNSFVVLRGVTQINNADPPVAVVVDGVPQNSQKQLRMNLFDVERIEVLKGPQGALYGRNAIGGAINIETKAPTNRFESFAGLTLGSGNLRELTAGAGGAIQDDVALFRVVGQALKSAGQLDNPYLNRPVDGIAHDDTLRMRLLLRPGRDWQVDLRASITDVQGPATWDSIVLSGNPNDIVAPNENLAGKTWGKTQEYTLKLDGQFDFGALTSITNRTNLSEIYRSDIDFSNAVSNPGGFLGRGYQAGQGQNLDLRMTSQELRLTSRADRPIRWIAGAYYVDIRRAFETKVFKDTTGALEQWDDPAQRLSGRAERNHNKGMSVFGQLDADLTQDLTLSAALRHDRDQRHQLNVASGAILEASFAKWQPKFTLTEKLGRDQLIYGTYSTGFRSGGFNAPGVVPQDFKAETLSNVEAGIKTVALDGRLLFNAAAFAAQSRNFQFFYVLIGAGQRIANIDKVNLRGADVDFRFLPLRGLEFDGGLGITDSTIKADAAVPADIGHHTPKNVPWKLTAGVQYSRPMTPNFSGLLRLDYEHRDRKYWHPDNAAVSDPLDLVNLRLALRGPLNRWGLALVGRNLANKRYYADYNSKAYTGSPYDVGSLAPMRTWALEFTVRL